MTNEVQLNAFELAILRPFFETIDARREGYLQGLETAKTLLVQQLMKQRQPDGQAEVKGPIPNDAS